MNDLERVTQHQALKRANSKQLLDERAEAISRLLESKQWTYRSLAEHFGVSHSRVYQWAHPPNGKQER